MTKNKNHSAFSLIEISMVILVIGILIAGISNGVDLYDDYRLKVAQNLTKNSRVSRIPDLELWFETTSENSLATGTASLTDKPNPTDQDPIGRWNNINPNILPSARNHATQNNPIALVDNQPKYIRKGMNGLPALKFDGSNDFFSFNGDFLVGSDYTIFVVEARDLQRVGVNCFIGGDSSGVYSRLVLGYRSSNSNSSDIVHIHWQSDLDKFLNNLPTNVMHSFIFNKVVGKIIYTNGGSALINGAGNHKNPLVSYANSYISKNVGLPFYKGAIAEIIFYTRALTDQERQGVEAYLSKKWGIKIG
jgi:prepilin-type N-terminal cleavage/methylation domain-containing protein